MSSHTNIEENQTISKSKESSRSKIEKRYNNPKAIIINQQSSKLDYKWNVKHNKELSTYIQNWKILYLSKLIKTNPK